jgi:hypothetical protein
MTEIIANLVGSLRGLDWRPWVVAVCIRLSRLSMVSVSGIVPLQCNTCILICGHVRTGQTYAPIGAALLELNDACVAAETCEELFTPDSPHILQVS